MPVRVACVAALAVGPVRRRRLHACFGRMSARVRPRIKMHSNNATHRRTAMIAKDLILTKDNCRIST
jgi:hypothetical protein